MSLDPIILRGSLHPTIWGGQHLATVAGKALPPGESIGESWETSVESVAMNPPYAGVTLGELTSTYGVRLYGTRAREVYGDRFPLLAKFIDAHAWLSVQVHPDDEYAARHEQGKLGKTEAWRILRTEPGAEIIHGVARATTRDAVATAIRENRLEDLTTKVPVLAGDVVLNHAGTLHATGAGIVLYEIQEYSDVTYRLYDFGRVGPDGLPRQLHIEQSLDVLSYTPLNRHIAQPLSLVDTNLATSLTPERLLVACRHFAMAEVLVEPGRPFTHTTDSKSCHIITVIGGQTTIAWEQDGKQWADLPLGQTVVVPAETLPYTLTTTNGARVLVSWVPGAHNSMVERWIALNA